MLRCHTSWGCIEVEMAGEAVSACVLPEVRHRPRTAFRLIRMESANPAPAVERFLEDLFNGRKPRLPRLMFPQGTSFQQSVWRAMQSIPFGETRTYGDLAENLQRPGAARAIGQACGANPLPLFIPCHRVVAAGNRLGGFSSGIAWKPLLLALEAAPYSAATSSSPS